MATYTVLQLQLMAELAATKLEFRLTTTLAKDVGASVAEVEEALSTLSCVRRPILATGEEKSWHRLVNRGLTRREKYRYIRVAASRQAR